MIKKTIISNQIFIDPVCCMKVQPANRDLMITYKMRSYHFCAVTCLQAFEADPEKYLNPKPPKRKNWWGRYLDRLEKTTGGKSLSCH